MSGVFISYSRNDLEIAETFEQALRSSGVKVWRDQESIYAGEQWPKAIGNAIADNDIVLLFWSENSKDSHYVEFEWNTAIALRKTILPVFVDNILLPPALSSLNGIPSEDIDSSTVRIKKQLSRLAPSDPSQNDEVIAELGKIEADKPEKVLKKAQSVFKQKKWVVGGNVYQVSGGDINITYGDDGGKGLKKSWLIGLAIALAAIILFALVKNVLPPSSGQTAQMTVFVHGPGGNQDIVLDNSGELVVDFGNDRRKALIGENGRTQFGEIPAKFLNQEIEIGLQASGFELIDADLKYHLDGSPIYLGIKKDDSLGIIRGIVKSPDGNDFIQGARIMIGTDTTITTDLSGVFKITLPVKMRIKDSNTPYRLSISKEGYSTWSDYYYPLSGDIEVRLTPQ